MKLSDVYLIIYNSVQVIGWASILIKTTKGLLTGYPNEKLYKNVEIELQIFQTAALLEVNSAYKW